MNIVTFIKAKQFASKSLTKRMKECYGLPKKIICKDLSKLVDDINPRISFAQAVAAYGGKWGSYSLSEVMETYFEK